MCEEKPNQREKSQHPLRRRQAVTSLPVFPMKDTGAFVLKALEYYHRHLERLRDDAR